jgi:hypothetical protein
VCKKHNIWSSSPVAISHCCSAILTKTILPASSLTHQALTHYPDWHRNCDPDYAAITPQRLSALSLTFCKLCSLDSMVGSSMFSSIRLSVKGFLPLLCTGIGTLDHAGKHDGDIIPVHPWCSKSILFGALPQWPSVIDAQPSLQRQFCRLAA